MKKIIIFLVFIFEIMCLSSCGTGHRRNYFVEGEFSGYNLHKIEEVYYLTVTEISKSEYESSQGINVVHDIFKKKYFSLELYYVVDQSNEKNFLTFSNLKDYGTPIRYRDDNRYVIVPFCRDYGSPDPRDLEKEAAYKIVTPMDKGDVNVHLYLYKGGRD